MPLDRKNKSVKAWVNTLAVEATSEEDALILLAHHASKGEGVERVEFETWDDFVAWCDDVLVGAGWTRTENFPTARLGGRGREWIFGGGRRRTWEWTFNVYRAENVDHGDDTGMTWVGAWGVSARGGNGYNF